MTYSEPGSKRKSSAALYGTKPVLFCNSSSTATTMRKTELADKTPSPRSLSQMPFTAKMEDCCVVCMAWLFFKDKKNPDFFATLTLACLITFWNYTHKSKNVCETTCTYMYLDDVFLNILYTIHTSSPHIVLKMGPRKYHSISCQNFTK